jgi:hypothetical protein
MKTKNILSTRARKKLVAASKMMGLDEKEIVEKCLDRYWCKLQDFKKLCQLRKLIPVVSSDGSMEKGGLATDSKRRLYIVARNGSVKQVTLKKAFQFFKRTFCTKEGDGCWGYQPGERKFISEVEKALP